MGGSVSSDMSSPVGPALTSSASASVGTLSMAGSLVCANAIIGTDAAIAATTSPIRTRAVIHRIISVPSSKSVGPFSQATRQKTQRTTGRSHSRDSALDKDRGGAGIVNSSRTRFSASGSVVTPLAGVARSRPQPPGGRTARSDFSVPSSFRMAGETGCGKDGCSATLENSTSFPLSHIHDGGDKSPNSSLSTWT